MVQLDGSDFKKINISLTVLKHSEKGEKTAQTEKNEIYVVIGLPGRITITEVLLVFPL